MIDEPWPPLRRVIIHGVAQPISLAELPDGLNGFLEGLSKRYFGKLSSLGLRDEVEKAFRIDVSSLSGRRSRQKGDDGGSSS
jgi:hypothetical protein